jgi:hypothetical protein
MVARDVALAERSALGTAPDYRVVAVPPERDGEKLVDLGVALLGGERDSELIISRFDPPFRTVEVGSGLTSELAAIAATFESMQGLSARAISQGARTVVRSQFSDDIALDLQAQLLAADADVVLVSPADGDFVRRLLELAECAVVVDDGSGPPAIQASAPDGLAGIQGVLVRAGSGDDALAAAEQAVRVASSGLRSLLLVDDGDSRRHRQAERLSRRLQQTDAGYDVAIGPMPDRPGDHLALVGWADWQSMPPDQRAPYGFCRAVLLVRAALDDHGERLNHLLDRSGSAPGGAPAGATMVAPTGTDGEPAPYRTPISDS